MNDSNIKLTNIFLSWDFYSDIYDDRTSSVDLQTILIKKGLAPPKNSRRLVSEQNKYNKIALKPLKIKYDSIEEYIERQFALLIIESKQSIYRAKETEVKIDYVRTVSQVEIKNEMEDRFIIGVENQSFFKNLSVGDLVLLYGTPPVIDHEMYLHTFKKTHNANLDYIIPEKNNARVISEIETYTKENKEDTDTFFDNIPNPLNDNPHHCLGVVVSTSFGITNIRIIVKETSLTMNEYKNVKFKNENTKRNFDMVMEFLYKRDFYRMNWLADKLLNLNDNKWYLVKIMSLTTIFREYKALMSMQNISLTQYLLDHVAEKSIAYYKINDKFKELIDRIYNKSQKEALFDCMKVKGITCIQGPPGTGKTTTIIGIVSVILAANEIDMIENTDIDIGENKQSKITEMIYTNEHKKFWLHNGGSTYFDNIDFSVEDVLYKEENISAAELQQQIVIEEGSISSKPKKILICAPSNAAVDEIMRRIVKDTRNGGGIYDANCNLYNPQILRVGPGYHEELKKWSLNDKVNTQKLQEPNKTEEAIKLANLNKADIICCTLSVAGSKEISLISDAFDTVIIDEASQGVEVSTLIPLTSRTDRLILVGDPKQLPATVFSKIALELKYDLSLFQRLQLLGYKINMLSIQYRMHPMISKYPSAYFYNNEFTDDVNILQNCTPIINYYRIPIFYPMVFININSEEKLLANSLSNELEATFICHLVNLLKLLFENVKLKKTNWLNKIAIISPYAQQVDLISKKLKNLSGKNLIDDLKNGIDINTVDGFQGREKDLVIFSAVRAQIVCQNHISKTYLNKQSNESSFAIDSTDKELEEYSSNELNINTNIDDSLNQNKDKERIKQKLNIGFLNDQRRLNVALTRARTNLWIVGNAAYLKQNEMWNSLINYCVENGLLINVDPSFNEVQNYLVNQILTFLNDNLDIKNELENDAPEFLSALIDISSKAN